MAELDQWINSAGEGGQRNSMQYLLSSGTQLSYEFNFAGGYIDASHVKAYIYHSASGLTTDVTVTLTGPNTIQLTSPVPVGDYLVVYRDTPKDKPLVDFVTGAVMNEENLDKIAAQAIFNAAEMVDRFSEIKTSSDDAIARSYTALTAAQEAVGIAEGAETIAGNAVTTANSAVGIANGAVTTAGDAVTTASEATDIAASAVDTADSAVGIANGAVSTADDAHSIATGIDAKAQSALDTSAAALDVANGIDAKATQAMTDASDALALVTDGQQATNVIVTPVGGITATNAQDALAALDSNKLNKADVLGGFKNKIINGAPFVAQRGISQSTQSYGSVDRWDLRWADATGVTLYQYEVSRATPEIEEGCTHFMRASGNAGANSYILVRQFVEGVSTLAGKTVTVRLWVRSTAGTKFGVRPQQSFGTGGSPSAVVVIPPKLVTIPSTGQWHLVQVQFDLPTTNGKTLGTNGDDSLIIALDKDMTGTMAATNGYSEAFTNPTSIDFTGVQLEEGPFASRFELRPIAIEEVLCKRFFERLYGTVAYPNFGMGLCATSTVAVGVGAYSVAKRVPPTMSYGSTFAIWGATTAIIPVNILELNRYAVGTGFGWRATVTGGIVSGNATGLLGNSGGTSYLDFNSELS